jgi:hypothetical protein
MYYNNGGDLDSSLLWCTEFLKGYKTVFTVLLLKVLQPECSTSSILVWYKKIVEEIFGFNIDSITLVFEIIDFATNVSSLQTLLL